MSQTLLRFLEFMVAVEELSNELNPRILPPLPITLSGNLPIRKLMVPKPRVPQRLFFCVISITSHTAP